VLSATTMRFCSASRARGYAQNRRLHDREQSRRVPPVDVFTLLIAVSTKDQDEQAPYSTSTAIARRLSVTRDEAEAALRDAEHQGLVVEEHDESQMVEPDFDRQLWRLSAAGTEKLHRVQDARRRQ
jgi:hypothetical protein